MKNQRVSTASSLLELTALLAVALAVALTIGDLFWILAGFSTNNLLCAKAARFASQGPPDHVTRGVTRRRVMAVLSEFGRTSGPLELSKTVDVTETVSELPDPTFGGTVTGDISVTTVMKVHPPFVLARMFGDEGFLLKTTKTYPFTYIAEPVSKVSSL